jgi:hypothetical protein
MEFPSHCAGPKIRRQSRICSANALRTTRSTFGRLLSTLLQGIKGVSANRCNKLLGCKSTFWMDESYDHIVPDVKELAAFRNYIAGNPTKAGLKADEYSLQLRNVLMP